MGEEIGGILPPEAIAYQEDRHYVYLSHDSLQFNPTDSSVFFDELNDQVIVYRNPHFFVLSFHGNKMDDIDLSYQNSHENIVGAKCSPDGHCLAIRYSFRNLELVNLLTLEAITLTPKKWPQANVFDVFWTQLENHEIILATSNGLEFLQMKKGEFKTKLVTHKSVSKASWVKYNAEENIIVVGGNQQGNSLHIFQLSASNIIQYPKFDIDVAHKNTVIDQKNVVICRLYTVLCCLHIDTTNKKLIVYRVYKEGVSRSPQEIDLYSENVSISIVDNILVLHNIDTKLSMIYDLKIPKFPFLNPLPLYLPPSSLKEYVNKNNNIKNEKTKQEKLYNNGWRFVGSDTVIDQAEGHVWKVCLNLQEISAACNDPTSLISFLMNRTSAKKLVLFVIRSMIEHNNSLFSVLTAFDRVNNAYNIANKQIEQPGNSANIDILSTKSILQRSVVDQGDLMASVFDPLFEQQTASNLNRLMECVRLYVVSLTKHKIRVSTALTELLIKLFASCNCMHQLELCVRGGIIMDSLVIARFILVLPNASSNLKNLGLDMLHRLGAHDEIMNYLIDQKEAITICNLIRKRYITHFSTKRLLELALESKDSHIFFTVYNFLIQRNFALRRTSEFSKDDDCDFFVQYYKENFTSKKVSGELF